MKQVSWVVLAGVLMVLPLALLVEADEDGYGKRKRGPDVAPAADEGYRAACGECHMAYPPGLLPARSWSAVMDGLADHFGDNAELPDEQATAIGAYLQAHGADKAPSKASRELLSRLLTDATPLRITELPGFRREHREISARLIEGNDAVRSLSQCQACHRQADAGYYDEHGVNIPGAGRWED